MNYEQEKLITENVSIVGRVVARETALGLPAWVDRSDLEGVANLALVNAARQWDGTGSFEAFAYTVLHRAVLKEIRNMRLRVTGRVDMPSIEALAEFRPVMKSQEMALYRGLSALNPREYRVIVLSFWACRTQYEIAAEMGISQGRVAQLLESAKKTLGELINSDSRGPIQMQGEREQRIARYQPKGVASWSRFRLAVPKRKSPRRWASLNKPLQRSRKPQKEFSRGCKFGFSRAYTDARGEEGQTSISNPTPLSLRL